MSSINEFTKAAITKAKENFHLFDPLKFINEVQITFRAAYAKDGENDANGPKFYDVVKPFFELTEFLRCIFMPSLTTEEISGLEQALRSSIYWYDRELLFDFLTTLHNHDTDRQSLLLRL